jgi:uncharacterized repeat protein (TIGR02059 family)
VLTPYSLGRPADRPLPVSMPMPMPIFVDAVGYNAEQSVTLYFDSALDAASPPPVGAFSMQVNGTALAVTSVSVDSAAKTVILRISHPLAPGDIVDVTYADPTSGDDLLAIQGLDGLDALGFSKSLVVAGPRPVPSVVAITRADGAGADVPANASEITYQVVFSEAVSGVDPGDFSLTSSGTAGGAISGVSGSGTTYLVKVSSLSGDGTLRSTSIAAEPASRMEHPARRPVATPPDRPLPWTGRRRLRRALLRCPRRQTRAFRARMGSLRGRTRHLRERPRPVQQSCSTTPMAAPSLA